MRRLLLVAMVSVFASVLAFGGGAAWAAPSGIGSGTCKFVAGGGTFSKPITLGGTASVKTVKINFKVNPYNDCSIAMTSPAGTVVSGFTSMVGTGTYKRPAGFANSCANFVGGDVVNVKVKTVWVSTPSIAPSIGKFGTATYTPPGASSGITYSGATAWAGSFATSIATNKLVLAVSIPDLTACTAATSVSSFTITGSYTAV
jgi:hypothetical protein